MSFQLNAFQVNAFQSSIARGLDRNILTYLRRYLWDTGSSPIYTDSYLEGLIDDGEVAIADEMNTLFHRFSLPIVAGTNTYVLPTNTKEIIRITWKGQPVLPLYQTELRDYDPKYRTASRSRPDFYILETRGLYTLTFHPTPSESISQDNGVVFGTGIDTKVIVSAWITPNTDIDTFILPDYFIRTLVKHYVLKRAMRRESDNKNVRGAMYHERRYKFLIQKYKEINSQLYAAKRRAFTPQSTFPGRPRRVTLREDFIING